MQRNGAFGVLGLTKLYTFCIDFAGRVCYIPGNMKRWIICQDTKEHFTKYDKYLLSEHWRLVKQAYYSSDRPQVCAKCGAEHDRDLHHLTYERIGRELLDDLICLCRSCHNLEHPKKQKKIRPEGYISKTQRRKLNRAAKGRAKRYRHRHQEIIRSWVDKVRWETIGPNKKYIITTGENGQLTSIKESTAEDKRPDST